VKRNDDTLVMGGEGATSLRTEKTSRKFCGRWPVKSEERSASKPKHKRQKKPPYHPPGRNFEVERSLRNEGDEAGGFVREKKKEPLRFVLKTIKEM